jgi:hypothetical protein
MSNTSSAARRAGWLIARVGQKDVAFIDVAEGPPSWFIIGV